MNQNYDQVVDMLAQGKLRWDQDSIIAMLYTSATFDGSNKTVADLPGSVVAVQPINQKVVKNGWGYGLPVAFPKVSAGLEYQVILIQDVGDNDPNLLAFIDVNADDSPITIQNSGTLIVRPQLPTDPPDVAPPTIGVWMRLSA